MGQRRPEKACRCPTSRTCFLGEASATPSSPSWLLRTHVLRINVRSLVACGTISCCAAQGGRCQAQARNAVDSIQGCVDARPASRHAALLPHFGGCRSCRTLDSCHPWKQYSRRCESHSWRPRTTTTGSQFTSLNGQERSITNGHFPKNWPNKSEQPGDTIGGVSDRTS